MTCKNAQGLINRISFMFMNLEKRRYRSEMGIEQHLQDHIYPPYDKGVKVFLFIIVGAVYQILQENMCWEKRASTNRNNTLLQTQDLINYCEENLERDSPT